LLDQWLGVKVDKLKMIALPKIALLDHEAYLKTLSDSSICELWKVLFVKLTIDLLMVVINN
jgi:hypothetical protein